jgi:2-polyprenyl-6-methoxyphenol hydroxylase-like FAD-dependent oxidoreductase
MDKARATLARFNMGHLGPRVTRKLSGGEKRLVCLAAILAMDPDVLLLDEPTNSLDNTHVEKLVEILSSLDWTPRQLVADSYGTQRVFLAGDSAHMTSPTGGFGMNLGIADAVDLSWKLDAMLKGWGGPRLLDSYEIERKPVAQRAVRESRSHRGRHRRRLSRRRGRRWRAASLGSSGLHTKAEFAEEHCEGRGKGKKTTR